MKITIWVLMLGLVMGLIGCDSKREAAMDDMLDASEDMVDQMAKIKSNTDLVDAKPKLEKLGARMKDEMKKMNDLGTPTAEEQAKIEKKFKPRMDKLQARMKDEMNRMSKDLGPGAFVDFFGAMNMGPGEGPPIMK
jgi:hypothetical protein